MTVHTVTLDLPQEVYQQARHVAQATRRRIEQVVVEWIQPPLDAESAGSQVSDTIAGLQNLPTDELIRMARAGVPPDDSRRLQELLTSQRQRALTESEWREAAALVENEDLVTLRKARALFLLKKRGILPDDLTAALA